VAAGRPVVACYARQLAADERLLARTSLPLVISQMLSGGSAMSKKSKDVASRGERREPYTPINSLREEIDRLFDDFTVGWPFAADRRPGLLGRLRSSAGIGESVPNVDVIDKDKSFEIRAELPGVDEKDIDLRVTDDAVMLKAEKREEREEGEEGGSYYVSECRYGSFQRVIPLPLGVDASDAHASFKRGVLSVKFPKNPAQQEGARKIEVKAEG
jgi:HSP20 family protein